MEKDTYTLTGLENLNQNTVKAAFISDTTDIGDCLNEYKACTSAGDKVQ